MQVRLPITDPDEIKTLRVSGTAVSDLIQVEGNADLWEIQFKRRVLGRVNFELNRSAVAIVRRIKKRFDLQLSLVQDRSTSTTQSEHVADSSCRSRRI